MNFQAIQNYTQISQGDIIIILLSIVFPLMIMLKEELGRKIDIFKAQIYRYINKAELNKSENYFRWLDLLTSDQKKMMKFLTETLKVEDEDPLLLPGRSTGENERLKHWQTEIKKLFCIITVLNYGRFIIPIAIIILLLTS